MRRLETKIYGIFTKILNIPSIINKLKHKKWAIITIPTATPKLAQQDAAIITEVVQILPIILHTTIHVITTIVTIQAVNVIHQVQLAVIVHQPIHIILVILEEEQLQVIKFMIRLWEHSLAGLLEGFLGLFC